MNTYTFGLLMKLKMTDHMGYTTCPCMFTLDQEDRMLAALSSEVARRNNLRNRKFRGYGMLSK